MSSIEPVSGIYTITNTITQKLYLGSSVNIPNRWRQHRNLLRQGKHHSPALQRSWNKHVEKAFVWRIVELVLPPFLHERENYWLQKLRPYDPKKGYNIGRDAIASQLGRIASPQTRAKLSASHKGKPGNQLGKKASPETLAKLSAIRKGKPGPNRGKAFLPETLAKMSAARKGKPNPHLGVPRSPSARAKIAEAGRGRVQTPSARAKVSAARMGNTHGAKDYIVTSPDGREYTVYNLTAFCAEHGLTQQALSSVAAGKRPHHKGWKARLV